MKKILIGCIVLLVTQIAYAVAAEVPYWLKDYKELYKESPRAASKAWFREAKFGLFVHVNLSSLLERGKLDYDQWMGGDASDRSLKFIGYTRTQYEAAQTKEEKTNLLFRKYELKNFDAKKMCDLAIAAEMRYITFTVNHLGGCSNFGTKLNKLNSVNAPAGRDLVRELAVECKKRDLALMLYVPPSFARTQTEKQTQNNRVYLTELLTEYGPIAGVWFDGVGRYHEDPTMYEGTQETFEMIRKLQPQALISFKTGATLSEDFVTTENYMMPFKWKFDTIGRQQRYDRKNRSWPSKRQPQWEKGFDKKLREICTTMQFFENRDGPDYKNFPAGWINDELAPRLTVEEIYLWLSYSRNSGANLLLNVGPRADGSIHPEDWKALVGVGEVIRTKGWPPLNNRPEGL